LRGAGSLVLLLARGRYWSRLCRACLHCCWKILTSQQWVGLKLCWREMLSSASHIPVSSCLFVGIGELHSCLPCSCVSAASPCDILATPCQHGRVSKGKLSKYELRTSKPLTRPSLSPLLQPLNSVRAPNKVPSSNPPKKLHIAKNARRSLIRIRSPILALLQSGSRLRTTGTFVAFLGRTVLCRAC